MAVAVANQTLVSVRNLWKMFGYDGSELPPEMASLSKSELREDHGNDIGLKDVSFDVAQGEIFVVMGLSGSGKSTLIRTLSRLIEPSRGSIFVSDDDILDYDEEQLIQYRRTKTAMVFQHFGLLPHRTVIEIAAWGLEIQGGSKDEREAKAKETLEMVGLQGWEEYRPTFLSGGMQQRVGLARALATNTDIMLMDEAFSALDPLIRSDMQKQLIDLQAELKKTIVFITHDLDESLRLGDHIGILNGGRLVQVGTPIDIIMNPADDYVAAFVKDVNRAKVIKAKIIMVSPQQFKGSKNSNTIKVKEDTFIDEFLPKVCLTPATVEVVDKSGNVKGYITDKELSKALTKTHSNGVVKSQK